MTSRGPAGATAGIVASATRSRACRRFVNTVRATGASNPVLLGGLAYANDLSSWLAYRPTDSTGNLLASWHSYNFNKCLYNVSRAGTARSRRWPRRCRLVAGEVGENDCAHGYLDSLLPWLDSPRRRLPRLGLGHVRLQQLPGADQRLLGHADEFRHRTA